MNAIRDHGVNPELSSPNDISPRAARELAQRQKALIELLDSWEREGDEAEQRETLNVLREALGRRRVASSRAQFP